MVIGNDKFEVVGSFFRLGDSIGQSGGCFEATAVPEQPRTFSSFPVPINRGILMKVRGHAYNAFTRSVLLYASETWTVEA